MNRGILNSTPDQEREAAIIVGGLIREIAQAQRWQDVVEAWRAISNVRMMVRQQQIELFQQQAKANTDPQRNEQGYFQARPYSPPSMPYEVGPWQNVGQQPPQQEAAPDFDSMLGGE